MDHNQEKTMLSYQTGEQDGREMHYAQQGGTPFRPTLPGGTEFRQASPARKWLARLGVAGFMFFFIKGLVWLAVIFGVGKCVL